MIDIENATHSELVTEYNKCQDLWGKYSCDSFGFYIGSIHNAITKTGKGFKI